MSKLILSALLVFVLTACGGGGGDGGGGHHEPVNTTRYANGVWHGTVFPDSAPAHDLTVLVLNGVLAGASYDISSLFSGFIVGEDEFLSGEMTRFDSLGEPVDDLILDGVFHPDDSMDLLFHAHNEAGSIELNIDPVTYEPAGLHILAGHYQDIDGEIDLLITDTGEIDGSDLDGCSYHGFAHPADDGINIYEMVIDRFGCPAAAEIHALATHFGGGVIDVFVRDSNEHMQLWEISETP